MLKKKRKAKISERGIYLQDSELQDTQFKAGERFKWVMDVENRKMIILPSEDEGNLISKRMRKDRVNPVIDIRKKEVLSVFKGCEYLQVEIFDDQILVEGYIADETVSTHTIKESKKIVDIKQFIPVKKKATALLSRHQLQKVVGQHSIDDIEWMIQKQSYEQSEQHLFSIDEVLKDIQIPLETLSLFCGSGLMDQGFIDAGFDIVYSIEKDKDAAETYRHNIGNHIHVGDIREVDKTALPKVPLLVGGSPCQGFSNSNRYSNFLDNPNNLLVREYIQTVQSNENLKVFVLENVPQLLTAGNGKFLEEIQNELSGFEFTVGVLNAKDYGVAQNRRRAFIIGSSIGKVELPKPTVQVPKTVQEAFIGLTDDVPNQKDVSEPKRETLERMKYVPEGGNIHDIPAEIRSKGTHSSFYRRLKWDEPSCAIVNFRKSMIMPPHKNRILSVREAARLFGVKDNFVFKGPLSSRQQQVANGVPTPMAKAIAMEVKKTFTKYFTRIKNSLRKNELVFQ